jgi:hypothetical protein
MTGCTKYQAATGHLPGERNKKEKIEAQQMHAQ